MRRMPSTAGIPRIGATPIKIQVNVSNSLSTVLHRVWLGLFGDQVARGLIGGFGAANEQPLQFRDSGVGRFDDPERIGRGC